MQNWSCDSLNDRSGKSPVCLSILWTESNFLSGLYRGQFPYRSNSESVSCLACIIIIISYSFFFRTRDCHRKSPKPHHIQPPNSTHTWTLIRYIAARVSVLIRITVLDLEPDPCFQIFLNISKTNYRIFNCNMSNRRSGQELPFILFELRATTCLWGRYDPKTENFTYFYIYLLHIHSFSKTFYILI